MKKRSVAVFLVVILAVTLCSCGSAPAAAPQEPVQSVSETAPTEAKADAAEVPVKEDAPEADAGGDEDVSEAEAPVPEEAVDSFTPRRHRICAGASACAVLMDDGTVVCSLDSSPDQYIDVHDEWTSWTDIIDIDMNEELLAALRSDGTVVWCGGRVKEYDILTDPETMDVIGTWDNMVQVAAGIYDIAALRADGSVEVTGYIWTEDLDETDGFVQVAVYNALVCLREDGTVYCYAPFMYEGQTWSYDVSGWSGITQVSAGYDHIVALKADGTVVATGNNEFGQCDVEGWTDIVQVCAGREHTLGLKADGTVVTCGHSLMDGSELALGSWTDIVELSGFFNQSMGLKADGSIIYASNPRDNNPAAFSIH